MALATKNDLNQIGSLGGRKIGYTVDWSNMGHVMSVMIDLYERPLEAVIREYTTNALDAHIAGDVARPVEISTPGALSPFLVIQDFGPGLSEIDIEEVYSQFFNSTKRGNNLEAGMLGLGSKSGLTYTSQYTIESVKDGVKLLVSVSREADGSAGLEIVHKAETSDHSGVTIKIPILPDDVSRTRELVNTFGKYVTPGKLLINGAPPERDFDFISETIAMSTTEGRYSNQNSDRVVMGNVSYPTGSTMIHGYEFTFFAELGAVEFPPNRERLMDTKLTRETIKAFKDEAQGALVSHVQKKVDEQDEVVDAFKLFSDYYTGLSHTSIAGLSNVTHRGVAMPPMRWSEHRAWWAAGIANHSRPVNKKNVSMDPQDFEPSVAILTNFNNRRFTRVQAEKIEAFLTFKGFKKTSTVIFDDNPQPMLYPSENILDWEEVKKFRVGGKLPRQPRVKNPVSTYETFDGYFIEVDDKKTVYFASKTFMNAHSVSNKFLNDDNLEFFYITDGNTSRFLKKHPKAQHVSEIDKKVVREYLSSLTQDDYDFYKWAQFSSNLPYGFFDVEEEVEDPDLKLLIRHSSRNNKMSLARERYVDVRRHMVYSVTTDGFKLPEFREVSDGNGILDKYPLLQHVTSAYDKRVLKHLVDYVNMIYTNTKK